jgi:hypothetical protein
LGGIVTVPENGGWTVTLGGGELMCHIFRNIRKGKNDNKNDNMKNDDKKFF